METDLNTIKKISEEKWDENWKFRSFLKCYDIPIEALDSIVHKPRFCSRRRSEALSTEAKREVGASCS